MPRSYRPWLIGFFLFVIFSLPLAQAVVEATRGEWPQVLDIFRQTPTAASLRAFERDMERSSTVAGAMRPWVQYMRFMLLRDPGEKAILGRDGWLFYKPDVQYLIEPCNLAELEGVSNPVSTIVRFRDQLASRGIHLLVVPIPAKPSVYPDLLALDPNVGAAPLPTHTQALLARLRAQGVDTVDLLTPLLEGRRKGAGFLQRDTHWSAWAARNAGDLAAREIRARHWDVEGSTDYLSTQVSIRRRGDLVRMMEAPKLESRFPDDEVVCDQVTLKSTGKLYNDDANSPILVLGDSYLRIYQTDEPRAAGFIAHLARALHTPLTSIVNDGGASTLVRRQLARSPGLLTGKKLVVWEFVERDIRFGAEGWQDVPLPAPAASVSAAGVTSR